MARNCSQRATTQINQRDKVAILDHADKLNVSVEALERHCRNFNQYRKIHDQLLLHDLPHFTETPSEQFRLPRQVTPSRLTDIEYIDPDTDQLAWVSWLSARIQDAPNMTVMHMCDVHEPFSDPQAVDLFMIVAEQAQPDVIVVGSDFADMYLSSAFDKNPEFAIYDDEVELFVDRFQKAMKRIKKVCPLTKLVFIWGNHERRLFRYVQKNAGAYHNTITKTFINGIKCNGDVWYIGKVDHVRIGPLSVEHGVRHNDHVAKARLIDEGGQISIMMGHVHKRNFYEVTGADFSVNSVSSGCLCPTEPLYLPTGQDTQSGRKWTQGTAVASFSLRL